MSESLVHTGQAIGWYRCDGENCPVCMPIKQVAAPERGSELHREAMEQVAARAVEAIAQVDEWLGSASTRQAAEESLWRLRRALQRAGYEILNGCLEYRGSILRAMEHAGVGMDDEGVIRIRRYSDKPWQHASGEPLYEVLYRMRMKASRT